MNPPSGAKDTRAVKRRVWMTMLFVMLWCVLVGVAHRWITLNFSGIIWNETLDGTEVCGKGLSRKIGFPLYLARSFTSIVTQRQADVKKTET